MPPGRSSGGISAAFFHCFIYMGGKYILLKQGGGIEITTEKAVTINAPEGIAVNSENGVTVSAPSVNVANGDVIASGISLKNHTHTGCQGGSTGAPN